MPVQYGTVQLVDYRFATALHDARYVNRRGSEFEVCLEVDWQEQCLAKFRACGREHGKKIAQGVSHALPEIIVSSAIR